MTEWLKKLPWGRIGTFAAGAGVVALSTLIPPAWAVTLPVVGTIAVKVAVGTAGVGWATSAFPHEWTARLLGLAKPPTP